MKRCPQCLFIYPETDTRCDFDNTELVVFDDAEIEAATQGSTPPAKKPKRTSKKRQPTATPKKRGRKAAAVIPIIGLLLGVLAILVYYTRASQTPDTVETASVAAVTPEQVPDPQPVSSPPIETASPSPSPAATPKSSPERIATSHSRTTAAPISTSGPGMGKKPGGKPVIQLSSGARIEADEVWRTRDGVWYRRNGIVTLLKHNRVKAVSNY